MIGKLVRARGKKCWYHCVKSHKLESSDNRQKCDGLILLGRLLNRVETFTTEVLQADRVGRACYSLE